MGALTVFSERRVAAILLISCWVVFMAAGILYTGRAIWKWPAGQTQTHLVWERGFVIAAALINLMGFVVLESLLRSAGDAVIGRLALSVTVVATAVLLAAEGAYLGSRSWEYPQIIIYVVLAFLAQAAFGFALLRTGIVPGWAGWVTAAWNLGWLVILPFASPKDIYFPALHHAAPLLIGIVLLLVGS
jgi:hypothetical protein